VPTSRAEVWEPLCKSIAEVLGQVLGKTVNLSYEDEIDPSTVSSELGQFFYSDYTLSGSVSGRVGLLFKGEDALNIANLMLQVFGMMAATLDDDMVISTLGELANQIISAFSNTLASEYGLQTEIEPGDTKILSVDEFPSGFRYLSLKLEIENIVNSNLYFLLDEEVMAALDGLIEKEIQSSESESAEAVMQSTMQLEPQSDSVKRGVGQVPTVEFGELSEQTEVRPYPENLDLLLDVAVTVSVEIGRTKMTLKELLSLGEGSIIQLDKLAGEPMNVLVNGKMVAKGEVVVIDESFGVRILEIVDPKERLKSV